MGKRKGVREGGREGGRGGGGRTKFTAIRTPYTQLHKLPRAHLNIRVVINENISNCIHTFSAFVYLTAFHL